MPKLRLALVALISLGALSACSSSSSPSTSGTTQPAHVSGNDTTTTAAATTTTIASSTTVAGSATVKIAKLSIGSIVTTSAGLALYLYSPDGDNATTSKCAAACASIWPPAKPGTLNAGSTGLTLASIARPDGTQQLTIDGHPAYTLTGEAAGTAQGEGVGGIWFAIGSDGKKV